MTNKKVSDDAALLSDMTKHLTDLQGIIESMDAKRGKIFIDWMRNSNRYLVWEESFDPSYLRAYSRGEIVFAHFGFNVGAEYGGMHYAVVIRDSGKSNPNINVVPLSSLEEGESEDDIHKDRVFLGVIEGMNGLKSVALPDQMRPISKIRVMKPKKTKDGVIKVSSEQMNLIDDKVRRLYTKINDSAQK